MFFVFFNVCARFDEFTTRPIEFRSVSDSTPRITLCNTDEVVPDANLQFRGCSLLCAAMTVVCLQLVPCLQ